MIRVLVLEDDPKKSSQICTVLTESGIASENIVVVTDATSAKRRMRHEYFDLAVLDIAVPWTANGNLLRNAGLLLASEAHDDPDIRCPMHMIGLTAYSELTKGEKDLLPASLFSIQLFEGESEEWRRVLSLRIQQIEAVRKHLPEATGGRSRAELGIICALDDPELRSVLALPWNWRESIVPGDPTIYHEGAFVRRGAQQFAVAATAPRMGLTAAAVTTAKLINAYRPRYLVMVGITAGVPKKTQFGDVIAADPIWDWGAGKWTSKRSELSFLPSPHQVNVEPRIRNLLRKLSANTAALASVKAAFSGGTPATELRVRVGPLASGAAVLADGVTVARITEEQNRDLLGVEMEAYGFVATALESSMPPPVTFVLKSVVDFGNPKKHDDFQRYGAYTSAAVMALFVQEYLD